MKFYKYYLIVFIVASCGKSNDPLAEVPLGKLDEEGIINTLKIKGLVTDNASGDQNDTMDILRFINRHQYLIDNNHNSYAFSVHFDREKYDFRKQRNMYLRSNDFSEKDFKEVISLYSKWYGQPNSDLKNALAWIGKNKRVKIVKHSFEGQKFYDIKYFTMDYHEENQKIKDSIERHQTIQNLVRIENPNCRWVDIGKYQRKFICDIAVARGGRYDYRKIKAVKFDLIIMDQFMRKLYIERDLMVELKNPLGPLEDLHSSGDFYIDQNNNIEFVVEYDIRQSNFHLEEIRDYSLKNTIKSTGLISRGCKLNSV